jgi:uncharacterized Zn finger protein
MQVNHPRFPPRARSARAVTWWGKAWVRAVEESAYDESDLRAARTLARSGRLGGITIGPGGFHAAVEEGEDAWTPRVVVPTLQPEQVAAFVEVVAAEVGRVAALLAGDLPHRLAEDAEESGVELLPYGGEFEADCSCGAWTQPCRHALALLYQTCWLVEDDPLLLTHLRGLPREDLLSALHARQNNAAKPSGEADRAEPDQDLEIAYDAAVRAARLLETAEPEPEATG